MKYSPRPFERLLTRFIARQMGVIELLYYQFIHDAVTQATRFNPPKDEDFSFSKYPALSRAVDSLVADLSTKVSRTIQAGCEWSWELANAKNDNMLSKILSSIGETRVPQAALDRWNQKNLPALASFEKRRIGGMGLSDKVWAYNKGIKSDLELALDLGIGEGMSADRLSRAVREYLNEPNRLYRRVRDEKGVLHLSKNAANYHPGQGVYRSSYKNAVRLAATETNMAYRTADNERMQEMDFILGYEVHLSDTNHTCLDSKGVPQPFFDICDELQGQYPKWFVFTGWHPHCRCYITTILPEKKEFIDYLVAMDENGVSSYKFKQGEITDIPPQMKEWLIDNQYRVIRAKSLPYFIKDNPSIMQVKDLDSNFSKALGMTKGKPMSYEEANTGRENPKRQKGVNDGYNLNCQTCTVVHEARRRGFDVEALPNEKDSAYKTLRLAGVNFWHRYENADGSRVEWSRIREWQRDKGYKGLSQQRVFAFLQESMTEVGRYEVTCDWRGRNAGHVWLAERRKDGTLFFYDPQTGVSGDAMISRYVKAAELFTFHTLRIDNKRIKPVMAKLLTKASK